jgi:hypothetical protein
VAGKFGLEGWTFAQVPIWAACDPRIGDGEFRLLVYLVWRQGKDSGTFPSLTTIGQDLGMTARTIRRRLRILEEHGYLETEQRNGRTSIYAVVADPEGKASGSYTPGPRTELSGVGGQTCPGTPDTGVPHDESQGQESRTKKRGTARKRATQPQPPAVKAFREEAHRFPPKAWWSKVAGAVGEGEQEISWWREVVTAWVGRGYNPQNVSGMLDWFRAGSIPPQGGNGRRRNGERGGKRERPRLANELGEWDPGEVPDLSGPGVGEGNG